MHQKKRKLFVLYSIPIWFRKRFNSFSKSNLCNKEKLYLVSYSISLSCMVVLLLGLGMMINPGLFLVDKSSAVTIQDEWVVEDNSSSDSSADVADDTDPVDDSFGGFGEDEVGLSQEDLDAGISPMSIVASPTLAITVSNSNQAIDAVQGGNTVYGSYNVGITGSNVKDYTLSIKADAVNLVSPSQASTPTTVTGAGGKTGDSMTANTWGYKLTETSTAESSYGTLNYASLPTSLQQIANGNVSSPYNLSMNKKLVFAAKFKDDAAPGTYKGHITLSAVANQAVVGAIWSNGLETNITDMQDISSGFCRNNSKIATGDTITLKDSRDANSYIVYKAGDGNCWMGENLRLSGPRTLSSSDSDVTSDWPMPADTTTWITGNNTTANNAIQIKTGSPNITSWKSGFGNYYSWAAATAGTGTTLVGNADTPDSVCPKGWKLPTYSDDYSFQKLIAAHRSLWLTEQTINGTPGIAGYYLGFNSTSLAQDANFWPAAGYYTKSLNNTGSYGRYWSRRGYYSDTGGYESGYAWVLYFFYNNQINPQSMLSRSEGYPIRCVATY